MLRISIIFNIDNELRHINAANDKGILTILYGPYNENYQSLQTDN